ncbi:MAG: hypothetical protein HKN17_05115 [Rhodothermales bacterium]|nr:hypothetical protein [Rhodothermales bacterium]
MKTGFRIVLIALVATTLTGCELVGGNGYPTETARARAQWMAHQDGDYSFVLTRLCECLQAGDYWIQVEDGRISIVQQTWDHAFLPEEAFDAFPTIEDLFDVIDRAIQESAAELHYSFDPDTGYPASIEIDWVRPAVDDEITYRVRSAVPGVTIPD